MGKSTELGISYCSSKTRIISVSICGWHQNGWKETAYGSHVEETDENWLILENLHHVLTMCTWDVLTVNANRMKSFLSNKKKCVTHEFLLEQLKSYQGGIKRTRKQSLGLMTWQVMRRNVRNDIANCQTKRQSTCKKVSSPCLNDHQFKQEELESVGECQKFAHRLSWNACTWHELDDLTFNGRSTSLLDQSPNGLKHATDDKQGWSLTFITQAISDNIVMWETRHSIADWVCFKTQTLLAILRTQHQPQKVSCVFLEVELLFLSVGCARSKLLCRTVLQNRKLFLWILVCEWMGYLLLMFGT